jgi:hypothetical protein
MSFSGILPESFLQLQHASRIKPGDYEKEVILFSSMRLVHSIQEE